MQVTFWGTRGSIPVSGTQFVRHGGATTCLEVTNGEDRIVIDSGTGLAEFGKARFAELDKVDIYQTHMHWDHVQGFPFFSPLFKPEAQIHMHAVRRQGQTISEVIHSQMSQPTFPVGLDIVPAHLEFHEIARRGSAQHGSITLSWEEMVHPGGCTAYRFQVGNRVLVFTGDVEVQQGCQRSLIELATGADMLIMDAQYFPSEYGSRQGFGHSTPMDAVDVAMAAGVARLVLTHHDPSHDDTRLAQKLELAREYAAPKHLLIDNAYDGMVVDVVSHEVEHVSNGVRELFFTA